jgi:nucleoside-diphosphate kinase
MSADQPQATLCIVKPDAVANKQTARVLQRVLDEGFELQALELRTLVREEVEGFYAAHRERGFFRELVEFMCSGPVVLAALRRPDAVAHWRAVIGSTNPADAAPGTLRRLYGTDVGRNAVHGSDSAENGLRETAYFFSGNALGR